MALVKHHKVVAALPEVLEPDSIYYVRAGQGHDTYVTNSYGIIVAYPANAAVGLEGKVDKVEGQALMTEAERNKLAGIEEAATANAPDAQLRDRATHTGTQPVETIDGLLAALDEKINTTERGVSGGVATLDEYARIPPSQLPSYIDDVREFATLEEFPEPGEGGVIYIAVNQGTQANPTRQYRWTGSVYAEINPSPGTTDALAEGPTNQYFSEHRVRNTVLVGLDLLTNANITAADTVLSALGKLQAQLGSKASLDSPAFTGSPTAQTAAADDNDTTIATTAFVRAAMALFGLGSTAAPLVPGGNIDSTTIAAGTYRMLNADTGTKPTGITDGILRVDRYNTTDSLQTLEWINPARVFTRASVNGVWGSWRETWHTGNLVKQTGPTDTTSGALMAVGAFGLGSRAVTSAIDFNELPTLYPYTGFIPVLANQNSLNSPASGSYFYVQQMIWGGGSNCCQIAYPYRMDNDGFWMRTLFNGSWSAWRRMYHSGNFDPATKQDVSVPVFVSATRGIDPPDIGKYLRHNTASAIELYLGSTTTNTAAAGAEITIRAAGPITLVPLSGVVIVPPSGGSLKLTAGMTVTLKKLGGLEWDLIGQTVAA